MPFESSNKVYKKINFFKLCNNSSILYSKRENLKTYEIDITKHLSAIRAKFD